MLAMSLKSSKSCVRNYSLWLSAGTLWLSLAPACGGAANQEPPTDNGGHSGDTATMGGAHNSGGQGGERNEGGAAGFAAGGSWSSGGVVEFGGSAGEAGAVLSVTGAERLANGDVHVELESRTQLYRLTCWSDFYLRLADNSFIRNEIPACGTGPYYFDGQYYENDWSSCNLGCDFQYCEPLPLTQTFYTKQILLEQPAGEGGAGGASATDCQAGAAGACQNASAPHYGIFPTVGPYWLYADYYTDDKCTSVMMQAGPLKVDVQ